MFPPICARQTSSESRRGCTPRPDQPHKSLAQVYRLFGFHPQGVRPRFPLTAPNDVNRVPETPNGRIGTPCHVPTATQPTPTVSAACGPQHTTNTRNYLQLLDRGQGWIRSRAGSYFRAQCVVVTVSWITNTDLSS